MITTIRQQAERLIAAQSARRSPLTEAVVRISAVWHLSVSEDEARQAAADLVTQLSVRDVPAVVAAMGLMDGRARRFPEWAALSEDRRRLMAKSAARVWKRVGFVRPS